MRPKPLRPTTLTVGFSDGSTREVDIDNLDEMNLALGFTQVFLCAAIREAIAARMLEACTREETPALKRRSA